LITNNVIEEVTETKCLGPIIDSNLKWDLQVDAVAKKWHQVCMPYIKWLQFAI